MANVFAEYLLNTGLYDKIDIKQENISDLIELIDGKARINLFCKECDKMSVFSMEPITYVYQNEHGIDIYGLSEQMSTVQKCQELAKTPNPGGEKVEEEEWRWSNWQINNETRVIHFTFVCAMDNEHKTDFIVRTEGNTMIKIGQYPSVADLTFPELQQYKKILSKDDMSELRKAIGLHAQGIGAGSYVYLRRILESLIEKAKCSAIEDGTISEKEYSQKKVVERIKILKGYLPDILSDKPVIYGIISKGIHELSEQDCIEFFPVLQGYIFMILQKWKREKEQAEAEKQLKSALSKIASKVN